jgi:hypothetical protein
MRPSAFGTGATEAPGIDTRNTAQVTRRESAAGYTGLAISVI